MSAPDTDAPDTDAPVTAPADAENRVHVERDGPVTVATLDAPAYRNSMGAPGIRDGLIAAIAEFEADPDQRAFVLTGAGGVFSAGGNLRVLREIRDEDAMRARIRGADGLVGTLLKSPKLYLAAVEGPAFGAALGLVSGADYAIAAEGAKFCAAQVKVGASPDGGLFWTLPLRIGRAAARRMLLTGEDIGAARAHALGLVDEVVPDGTVLEATVKAAHRLARGAPLAQATVKRFFADDVVGRDAVLEWERETAIANFLTADFQEGASAFLEKRRPAFRGE